MEGCVIRSHIFLLCFIATIKVIAATNNDTSVTDSRNPRVTGRVVKLYSGTKPEPIHCEGEGFQADPHNCAIFYRCMKSGNGKYTVFRFDCSPGTVYDPEAEVCNHPESTKRSECGGKLSPNTDSENVNEIEDKRQEIPSPITTKRPMYTEVITQKSSPIPYITSTVNYTPQFLNLSKETTIQTLTSSSWRPGVQDNENICARDGFMGDSENCQKFYRCVANQRGGYMRYEFLCSESTIWDDDAQGCNHAWAVKRSRCGKSTQHKKEHTKPKQPVQNEVPAKTSQQQLQISYGTEVTQTQTQISHGTAMQNQTHISQGDIVNPNIVSGSKQNQTQISHGSAVSQAQIQINNGNKGVQTQLQIDHSDYSSQYQTQGYESTTKKTSSSGPRVEISTNKNNACTQSGFMGDSNDCKKFYRCIDNGRNGYTRFEFSCGEGTVWDQSLEACNHAWAVRECGGKSLSETTIQDINTSTTTQLNFNPIITQNTTYTTKTTESYYPTSQTSNISNNNGNVGYGNENHEQTTISTTVTKTPTTESWNNEDTGYGDKNHQHTTLILTNESHKSTTHAPDGLSTECITSGFMGDQYNCKIFYRCVENGKGFTKYEFKCGEGTVWDPSIEACNHAWAVKRCGGSSSTDISKSEATTMSQTALTTSAPQLLPTTTTVKPLPAINTDHETGYGSQSSDVTTSTTTNKEPDREESKLGNTCKVSGFMGDENDCKRFYRCVDSGDGSFIRYEYTCGEGTVWDPHIEACNHAWAVKQCGGSASTDIDKLKPTTTAQTPLATPIIQNTTTAATIEPPHIDHADYDTGYGSVNSDVSSSTTTKLPETDGTKLGNDCKSSGFIGDENDCKKFYRCVDNGGSFIRYEFTCGEGTVWDSNIDACNHVWAVKKCGGSAPTDTNKVEVTTIIQTKSTAFFSQNIPTTTPSKPLPTDNNNYDTGYGSQSTTFSSSSTISKPDSHPSNVCKSSGFVGDKSDCKKFYRCVDNGDGSFKRYEFTCGEGTVWDPEIEACNHAWAVKKCGEGGYLIDHQETTVRPQQSTHETQAFTSTTHAYVNTDKTTNSYTTIPTTTTLQSVWVDSSKCNHSGFMGDKNDCSKFYRCVDSGNGSYTRYEFSCGEGTVWDPEIEACNHAWAVAKCGGSIESTDNNYQSTPNYYPTTSDVNQNYPENEQSQYTESHKTSQITTTQSTTEKISGSKGTFCKTSGFIGDKKDCKKFYRCVDDGKGSFIRYEFSCGEGTLWDPSIEACNHAWAVGDCDTIINVTEVGSTTSESEDQGYVQHTEATTKLPQNGYDDIHHTTTTPRSSSFTTIGGTSEDVEGILTDKPHSSGICNAVGFYGHPSDCKRFYRCVDNGKGGYTKYDFVCGDGTVWDPKIQSCNHETSSKCFSGSTTSAPQSNTSQTISSDSSSTSTNTELQHSTEKNTTSTGLNEQCMSEGFFAHPHDCKKFIRCVKDDKGSYTKYEFSCGEGTVWVQDILACDHDDGDTNCGHQTQSTTKPHTTEEQQVTSQDSDILGSSSKPHTTDKLDNENESTSSNKPSGSGICTSEGYYPHENDCRLFYRCLDNGQDGYKRYDYACGEGTAWDPEIQNCNHINQVKACHVTNEESGNKPLEMHEEDNGKTTEGTSPASTSSTTTSTPGSPQGTGGKDSCSEEGFFGNTKDCTQFYRCVDNGKGGYTKYDFTCAEGTIWDQDITTCNHPQDVVNPSCGKNQGGSNTATSTSTSLTSLSSSESTTQSSTVSTITQANTSSGSTSQSTTTSATQGSSNCSQEESSKTPVNEDINCTAPGYYPNPSDCKKYYRCVDWNGDGTKFSVYHFECGEGTIWDPALETCNHEENVYPPRNCKDTQPQNVSTSNNTTEETTTMREESTTDISTTSQPINEQTTQSSATQQTTTELSSTPEQSTIKQSTTSEITTTQQSTTSEQTTTEQSTTSEQTTQQTTTSKSTTTQQSTVSEQPTTQQSTTSEQTTLQPSTTSTTGQTTQESAATEQTTTAATTTEETTTQQSTTTELNIHESTTSEPTTHESTTREQTTQQSTAENTSSESSTTEQTTTQQSTTSEQTSHESTTSEQTTQESTTTEQTTQKSTTESTSSESTTTEQSTTEKLSTTEGITEQSTTEQSTTEQSTTQQSTTEQSTTQQSTTEQSTTEQSTTEQSTTESSSSGEGTTEGNSSEKECPHTDDNQHLFVCPTSFRRHPKYCNMFYQCTEDEANDVKIATFTCPNNTIYDENQTKCVEESKADKKCEGEIAQRRRFKRLDMDYREPIVVSKQSYACPNSGYFAFEKESECSPAFLKCKIDKKKKLRGFIYQCPTGYLYWSISKKCEPVNKIRDCKRSNTSWYGRWEIPVERRNVSPS